MLKIISTITIVTGLFLLSLQSFAALTSSASLTITAVVPEVLSMTTQSLKADLDLKPGTNVVKRPIGNLSFKYNEALQGITIASNTESGNPEDDLNKAYKFARPFTLSVLGNCRSLDIGTLKPGVTLVPGGADYKSLTAGNLTNTEGKATGISEDCQLAASWKTETRSKSSKGVYSMHVIVSMIAL